MATKNVSGLETKLVNLQIAAAKNPDKFQELAEGTYTLYDLYQKSRNRKGEKCAAELVTTAMQIAMANQLEPQLPKFIRKLALINRNNRDFFRAIRLLERSALLANINNDLVELAMTQITEGETYFMIGGVSSANEAYRKAAKTEREMHKLGYSQDKKKQLPLARINCAIGGHYVAIGKLSSAQTFFDRVDGTVDSLVDSTEKAQLLYNLGDFFLDVQNYDSAKKRFDEGRAISKSLKFTNGAVMATIGLGKTCAYQKDSEIAKECVAELERIVSAPDQNKFLLTNSLYALGIIYRETGNPAHSLGSLTQALPLYNDPLELPEARARRELARTLVKLGSINEAKIEYKHARQIFNDYRAMYWAKQITAELNKLAAS